MSEANIIVIGAGVVGLTTALQLSRHKNLDITILAKHMPGDYDIEYASPWAGANYFPVGAPGSALQKFERATWPELERICKEKPEAGIHFQDTVIYGRNKDEDSVTGMWFKELVREDAWFRDVVPNFRVLPKSELPKGVNTGTSFTSVCINTAIYLPYLLGQCLKNGVKVKRAILTHITDALSHASHKARPTILLNCTGLGSLTLGGVTDITLYPGRGQIVMVRNSPGIMATVSGTDDGDDEATYIMERAAGGGTILGGCLQKGKWESQPDPNMAIRIMKRSVELCPALAPKTGKIEDLSVIRHGVGLRPMRADGVRVEKERVKTAGGEGVWVVHNYGHGGYGYQSSYGAAFEAESLVGEILGNQKAKL